MSFVVEPGTIFGHLGRSGAGQSTTVRILATLTLPSSGSARVERIDVQYDLGALAAGIAFPSRSRPRHWRSRPG
jgi:ABC-2 type transport system ATP-binding protein